VDDRSKILRSICLSSVRALRFVRHWMTCLVWKDENAVQATCDVRHCEFDQPAVYA
jgi:hypothetical protein